MEIKNQLVDSPYGNLYSSASAAKKVTFHILRRIVCHTRPRLWIEITVHYIANVCEFSDSRFVIMLGLAGSGIFNPMSHVDYTRDAKPPEGAWAQRAWSKALLVVLGLPLLLKDRKQGREMSGLVRFRELAHSGAFVRCYV